MKELIPGKKCRRAGVKVGKGGLRGWFLPRTLYRTAGGPGRIIS